jgi:aminoglycoside phosphotransferase (APT) family kinase protein
MARALGWRPTSFRPAVVDRGSAPTAARWLVRATSPERRAFVKIGATAVTADWTRIEARTYASLRGWFLPEVLGFDDDGYRPALALEDLSGAAWPPPWSAGQVGHVLDALAAIHATPPPAHLTPIDLDGAANWQAVGSDPGPLLALGLCSAAWLTAALPALLGAAAAAPVSGGSLVHLDIRSDNLCFRNGRAVVLDWNHATIANAALDLAFWLPSLESEGGPPPESILPNAPGLAAWVAGFFCAHAGLPFLPDAPHVRALQLAQARTALPWAARAIGLSVPGR